MQDDEKIIEEYRTEKRRADDPGQRLANKIENFTDSCSGGRSVVE